jgi:hypothetical protein
MTVLRRLAARVLHSAVRRSSADSKCWGDAMLGELDFVESDWAAQLWALGSTAALLRHSVRHQMRTELEKRFGPSARLLLKNLGKKAIGILSGVVIASGVLTICVLGLFYVVPMLFPARQVEREPFVEFLTVIVIPETVFIAVAIALWRKKKPMAAGLLLAAMTFITHVVIHAATH